MTVQWMERFGELATTWLGLVLLASWRALPILVLAAGIGLALRRKLTPSLHALLLTIVLVRLLLPVSIGSPLSLHKPIDHWFSNALKEAVDRAWPMIDHGPMMPYAAVNTVLFNVDRTDVSLGPPRAQAQAETTTDWSWDGLLYGTIVFIVVAVSMGLFFRDLLSHIRFAVKLRYCQLLDEQPLIDFLLRECDSLAVGRRPAVREVPGLAAPAVFGIFRQTICLPPGLINTLPEQELRWVIRHELAHIRRRDIPVAMMASIVSAFHWFNPLVWLLVSRLRGAMEAAADRLALESLSQSDASAYGKLLLRFVEESVAAKKLPTLGLISFASGIHLKQRVELLMGDRKPNGAVGRFLLACLVAAVACVGLTDARESEQKLPDFHLAASDLMELPSHQWFEDPNDSPFGAYESHSPRFIEEYDIASILDNIPNWLKLRWTTPKEQLAAWLYLPSWLKESWDVEEGLLTANLTSRQHQLLKQMLEKSQHGEPKQIAIQARFIQTNIQTASSIDWAGRRVDGLTVRGLGPSMAARIEESDLVQLIQTVSADRRGNILLAPSVTMFDGRTASIADQIHRPFLTGVDPHADGNLQPVISVVDEGIRLALTPNAGEDDSVSLAFEVKAARVAKVSLANLPIRTSAHAAPHFTVQVPAMEHFEVSSSVKLAAGESIVVAIPRVFSNEPGADAETSIIVALTPRVITSGVSH